MAEYTGNVGDSVADLFAADSLLSGAVIQNLSTHNLWVRVGGSAAVNAGFVLRSGEAVSIPAPEAGDAVTAIRESGVLGNVYAYGS